MMMLPLLVVVMLTGSLIEMRCNNKMGNKLLAEDMRKLFGVCGIKGQRREEKAIKKRKLNRMNLRKIEQTLN